ncbi:MAG: alpha/beta hydrolase [Parvularculaceae bacterium]
MNDFPEKRVVKAGGVNLAVYEAGDGPPVLFVHGWPEIAYSWKNQIGAVADAGYRAIAFDLKGFGASDAPADKSLYDVAHMTGDFAALLDALEIDRAVFCGHDWGGALVWPMAQLHPARVAGVIGVCTPHRPPPPVPPMQIIEKRFGPKHYFVQFQEEGVVEPLFESDLDRFFRIMFRYPAPAEAVAKLGSRIFDLPGRFRNGPPADPQSVILGDEDLSAYIAAYARAGFRGGVNLYRNVDRNYEIMRKVDPVIKAPSLFVGAAKDYFLPPVGADGMEKLVPDLEKHVIEDCGHWVMWERPRELNAIIIDWLDRRYRR